jgi:uncharacterized protein YdcH (DUF465 family)
MDPKDEALIAEVAKDNEELKKLWDEHLEYKEEISELDRRAYLTPEQTVERKRLQKYKLAGKDRIEEILSHVRQA